MIEAKRMWREREYLRKKIDRGKRDRNGDMKVEGENEEEIEREGARKRGREREKERERKKERKKERGGIRREAGDGERVKEKVNKRERVFKDRQSVTG